jgi:ribose 5-phosphate isomerase B
MKIVIGADIAGFDLKNEIKAHLAKEGINVLDIGMDDRNHHIPYYEIAAKAAAHIQQGVADRAILFCGTGMGVAIVANKFKGIYASVVESEFTGQHCKVINNSNVLTMGGWVVSGYRAKKIVDLWLGSSFTEGYDEIEGFLKDAIVKIETIEDKNMNDLSIAAEPRPNPRHKTLSPKQIQISKVQVQNKLQHLDSKRVKTSNFRKSSRKNKKLQDCSTKYLSTIKS